MAFRQSVLDDLEVSFLAKIRMAPFFESGQVPDPNLVRDKLFRCSTSLERAL